MSRRRTARRIEAKGRTKRLMLQVAVVLAVLGLAAAAFLVRGVLFPAPTVSPAASVPMSVTGSSTPDASLTPTAVEASATSTAAASPVSLVEVPQLIGKTVADAELLLSFAGLVSSHSTSGTVPGTTAVKVAGQVPAAGVRVPKGTMVRLTLVSASPRKSPPRHLVVVIDPGHQARSDTGREPIGPGSKETKDRVTGGATGIATHIPEYQIALQISLKVKALLEKRGIQVVMTRTTDDVRVSNVQRAEIANRTGADLFLRIHADSDTDPSTNGISTLYPASNAWTKPIAERSLRAATLVEDATVKATGATRLGVKPRGDLSGFNWSKVPVILVETGFMSNAVEDRLLASPGYQDKLATGISAGTAAYLGR